MTLYEVTGDKAWLEKSRQLAHLVATWTTSYDNLLPQSTELRKLDARLAGVVWASTQNKHGASGICTQSGYALFKLTRATGNTLYAELLRDIVHAHAESIRPGGLTNERLTYRDVEHRGYRGTHVAGWCETNGTLMAVELPGIYVRKDTDTLIVFDHVQVQREDKTLTIHNPTPHDAKIKLLIEDAAQAAQPLGENAFLGWPTIHVPSEGSLRVDLDKLQARSGLSLWESRRTGDHHNKSGSN